MISAVVYVKNYYGDKERAVSDLEKWIKLYENSPRKQTPKIMKRLADYKQLLSEVLLIKE